MAIDFSKFDRTFGQRNEQVSGRTGSKEDRPKTQFWLNIGYETDNPDYPFVSLPVGIPLDNQERIKANSSNQLFAAFCAARNDMLDQLLEEAQKLQPGEEVIIGVKGSPFQMQIRRINVERADAAADESNPFVRKMLFAAPVQEQQIAAE